MNVKAKHEMTKTSDANATIALKTLHNDIVNANPNFTRTTKQMRVVLRAQFNDIHERNASWTFTQSQYDRVRSHFDPAYATKIERASKRKTKTNNATTTRKPRKSRVIDDNANDTNALVINNETHDANA